MGRALRLAALVVVVAAGAAITRLPPLPHEPAPEPLTCDVPVGPVTEHLARMLQFRTLGTKATPDHIKPGHEQEFRGFLEYLEATYPLVFSTLEVEKVGFGNWTLLLTWRGSDPSLLPAMFISHYDVVPVAEGTEQDWTYGPFDGKVVDGVVWGRGALDIKFAVAAIMEAVERLIAAGWAPTRSLMFSWGHDEEIGGMGGALQVAQLLQQRGVELDVVVDEGGTILMDGLRQLAPSPVALIGTAEKLYTSIEVSLRAAGGHSSMPPTDRLDIGSQAGRLLHRLATHQPPIQLRPPMIEFLSDLAPYQPIPAVQRLMLHADTWPLRWLWAFVFSRTEASNNALVRTTAVATQLHAGVADNVMPITGSVNINIRSHPSIPRQEVFDYVTAVMKAANLAPGATMRSTAMSYDGPPGVVTPSTGRHFQLVKQAIQEFWRTRPRGHAVAVAPYMLLGGTDSKHYAELSRGGVLRVTPYQMNRTAGELDTVHSTNERVRAADLALAVCTYRRVLQLLGGK